MGSANNGGVLFYGMLDHLKTDDAQTAIDATIQSLTLSISNSKFTYNRALKKGAVIYLDDLDFYELTLSNVIFEKNAAVTVADNIYAK